jgi:hypothetical protein
MTKKQMDQLRVARAFAETFIEAADDDLIWEGEDDAVRRYRESAATNLIAAVMATQPLTITELPSIIGPTPSWKN